MVRTQAVREGAVGHRAHARGLHPPRLGARLGGGHLRRAARRAHPALQGPQAAGADHRLRHGAHREARPAQDGLPRACARSPCWPTRWRSSRSRGASTIDFDTLPLDDAKTYTSSSRGARRSACSSWSRPGMRDALRGLRPERLEDLIAMVSLYRPGPDGADPRLHRAQARPGRRSRTSIPPWRRSRGRRTGSWCTRSRSCRSPPRWRASPWARPTSCAAPWARRTASSWPSSARSSSAAAASAAPPPPRPSASGS